MQKEGKNKISSECKDQNNHQGWNILAENSYGCPSMILQWQAELTFCTYRMYLTSWSDQVESTGSYDMTQPDHEACLFGRVIELVKIKWIRLPNTTIKFLPLWATPKVKNLKSHALHCICILMSENFEELYFRCSKEVSVSKILSCRTGVWITP